MFFTISYPLVRLKTPVPLANYSWEIDFFFFASTRHLFTTNYELSGTHSKYFHKTLSILPQSIFVDTPSVFKFSVISSLLHGEKKSSNKHHNSGMSVFKNTLQTHKLDYHPTNFLRIRWHYFFWQIFWVHTCCTYFLVTSPTLKSSIILFHTEIAQLSSHSIQNRMSILHSLVPPREH